MQREFRSTNKSAMHPRGVMRYMETPDAKRLINELSGESWICAMLQWRAGLRISEALNIRPADINIEDATLTVRNGKGGKGRIVPLHEDLSVVFRSTMRPLGNGPYVRAHRTTMWRRYRRAGIPDTHCLRHSAARSWLKGGITMPEVSLLLGHSSVKVTAEIYSELREIRPGAMEGVA